MKITEKLLLESGFEFSNLLDESPYEMWGKDQVEVWNFNKKYWLVEALDQSGLHVEFRTMEHLSQFFVVCGLDALVPQPPAAKERKDGEQDEEHADS